MRLDILQAACILASLLLLPAFSAEFLEQVLEIELSLNQNGSANLLAYSIVPAASSSESLGSYRIVLSAGGTEISEVNFSAEFLLLTDPPEEVPESFAVARLPIGNASTPDLLEIFSPEGKLLLSEKIALCNADGLCSSGENALSCPSDCPAGGRDSLCQPDAPGCDPDCEKAVDSNCGAALEKVGWATPAAKVFGFLAVVGILGGAYVAFRRKR
ncbi:MAG: hypothetical protein V1820_05835 [archaeon]